jgi:hypothetical protein
MAGFQIIGIMQVRAGMNTAVVRRNILEATSSTSYG